MTNSGGESGWDPGAPGPGGVRFAIVTRHVLTDPPDFELDGPWWGLARAVGRTTAATATAATVIRAKRFIRPPWSVHPPDSRRPLLRNGYERLTRLLRPLT